MPLKANVNSKTIKDALVYLIADANLPFTFTERKSFKDFVRLLNEQAASLITGRNSLTAHLYKIYAQSPELIKLKLLSNKKYLAFTTNAWSAPNVTAFMAVTVHFITEDFEMKDLTLAIPNIQGPHTGKNFVELFHDVLKSFNCEKKVCNITADNESTNNTMAQRIGEIVPTFLPSSHLLGCAAHVINLGAKSGLAIFGGLDEEIQLLPTSSMDINFLVNKPSRARVNLKTVLKQIHGLSVYVRASAQRREHFEGLVKVLQPLVHGQKIHCLILDVETRWNSTFEMFKRALLLKTSCKMYCAKIPEAKQFLLTNEEWQQAENFMNLLLPLSDATNFLCQSRYPSLNATLPVYMVLVEHLRGFCDGLYDQEQLIQPANHIVQKVDHYFWSAIEKPVYICAMLLDPRVKMTFWKDNARFIQEKYSKSPKDILATFHQVAKRFREDITPAAPTPEIEESSSKGNLFQRSIFSTTKEVDSLDDEIKTYLREETKKSKKDILCYWKGRQDSFPTLAKMARCFLAIQATSAPSE
ncbi:hypothetical protein PCANC_13454 [Puccinia coronata f. sp. avenae]|uniref:HAT C-terminal dimerisation domain-containing protein n=1 Tax=Puccinia coronata f. sp. avenae TaxID=200324 RepID=A0A2N5SR86_9BASI|nr:hypothetical protein PCANC_13454 [Puccinia coronata f. sp. avenae]